MPIVPAIPPTPPVTSHFINYNHLIMNNINEIFKFDDDSAKTFADLKIKDLTLAQSCSIYYYIKYLYTKTPYFMVALLVDYIKEGEPRLYCGQMGVLEMIINFESCLVTFEDHFHEEYQQGDDKVIHSIIVSFVDIMPLFFQLPALDYEQYDSKSKLGQERIMRKNWYSLVIEKKHKNQILFKPHLKSKDEFKIGQFVAVQDNFVNQKNINTPIVYGGQAGRIIEIFQDSYVKVEFGNVCLDHLIDPSEMGNIPASMKKTKHSILKKDYLLPLYAENLSKKKLYYGEYITDCIMNNKPINDSYLDSKELFEHPGYWKKLGEW